MAPSRLKIDILIDICRSFGKISSKLESSNPRPRNPRHGCGLQARTHGSPRPTQCQSTFALFVNGVQEDRGRNFGTLIKGGLDKCNSRFRPVCKQFVFSSKRRRGFPPADQFEGSKRIPSVQPLQDGGNPSPARLNAPQRLVGQNRSQGRVFRGPHLGKSQEISPISLEGLSSRVCVPALRPSGCTQSIHKDHETGCCPPTTDWHSADYLLGRPSFYELVQGRSSTGHDYSSVLARESRLRNKPREIFLSTDTTVGVSRVCCEYSGYDSAPARLQGGGDQTRCSKILLHHEVSVRELFKLIGKLTASVQAIFPAPLHYRHLQNLKHKALARFGHFDATTPLSTEAKDELQWWLAHLNTWNGRALLRPSPDVIIETHVDSSRSGWGAVCQGVTTGGLWSKMEKKLHINCLELLAGSFAVKSFTKDRFCVHVRLRMDNVSAVAYINRLGGGGTHSLILSNLALALWECMGSEMQHISQCRTSIGGSECVSGLGVAPFRRLERLEALPSDIPLVDAGQRSLRARPVRESSERPVNPVLQLEAGSDDPSNRRPLAELGSRETIRISPLLSYNALSGEAQRGGGRTHSGASCVANTVNGIRVFWNCRSPLRFSYLGVPSYFRARRVNHTRW